jgi:hypothetical protein
MQKRATKKGFATLFSVIILMLLSLMVVSGVLISGVDGMQINSNYRNGILARALAESCGNVALNKLKIDNTYSGTETVTLGTGSCQILAITGSGNTSRVIQATGTVGTSVRKIEISVATLNPNTVLNYWNDKVF